MSPRSSSRASEGLCECRVSQTIRWRKPATAKCQRILACLSLQGSYGYVRHVLKRNSTLQTSSPECSERPPMAPFWGTNRFKEIELNLGAAPRKIVEQHLLRVQ